MRYAITITLLVLITATGCKTKQHSTAATDMKKVPTGTATNTTTTKTDKATGNTEGRTAPIPAAPPTYGGTAHAVIYKTKSDYSQYVPVTLSDDGSAIVSYPAPTDIYYKGTIATPTPLAGGYLLDNRGVTPHSAFIRITYADYAKLKEVPALKDMYKLIIDKTPFTEMYDLGERNLYEDAVGSLNTVIKSGKVKEYKKLL